MTLTLVVMAAGLSSRFGRPKQLASVGPSGEALVDYTVYDAARAGFDRVVVVMRRELADAVRDHAEAWFPPIVDTVFVEQRLDALPAGIAPPSGRLKPWGTGKAVLAAGAALDGPFAVCNADDFYGAAALRTLARFLSTAGDAHALVGYRLDQTLSPHGGVARAVCECAADGTLRRIVEVVDLRRTDGAIVGRVAEEERTFSAAAVVSMNLWGFRPTVLTQLAGQFTAFLGARGADPDAEFLLSTAVNEQVAAGRARLQVLATSERWLGLTFAADLAAARAALAALVRDGVYPGDLRTGFARL